MNSASRRILSFLTAASVFGLDRWSKWIVEMRFGAIDTKIVIPGFFNIVRSQNPGVAFGILSEESSRPRTLFLIALSLCALMILAWMLWRIDRQDRLTATGLSLIFGGALGNVYDRVRVGTVTDFLDFYSGVHHWYTFNVADSAICVGAGMLIISMLFAKEKKEVRA